MGLISNGTSIFDAGTMAAGLGGSMVFIKKLTASSSADLTFVHGASSVVLDGTYKEYLFTFKNIHCATEDAEFNFQGRDGGSDYDATITSNAFQAIHGENDTTFLSSVISQKKLTLAPSTSNFINLITPEPILLGTPAK